MPLKFRLKEKEKEKRNPNSEYGKKPPRLYGREKESLAENLSLMLAAGMDVGSAVHALLLQTRSQSFKNVIAYVAAMLENGEPLWRALEQSRLFSAHAVSLVRIGESAGRLSQYLQLVAEQQQKEKLFKSRLRSASFYPLLVLVIAFVAGISVSWAILPRLASVFTSLNVELPWITKVLIGFGQFLDHYGMIAVPLSSAVIILSVFFLFFYGKTRFIGQNLILHTPFVRELIREVELARMGFVLGTLLKAGLPIIETMEALVRSTELAPYLIMYQSLQDSLEQGLSFEQSFAIAPHANYLVPVVIQQMLVSGERSGRVAETFIKIGEIYEAKAEITTKNLTTILEPVLLVIVALAVVGVALAVILPIYKLVGSLQV